MNNIKKKINKIKKMNLNGKMDWEIDYFELDNVFQDEKGNIVRPLLLVIVHPESYYVIGTHLVSPFGDYLPEFLEKILDYIEKSEFCPGKILVKKSELFTSLKDILKDLNIRLELIKRTKSVESFKKESKKFFK